MQVTRPGPTPTVTGQSPSERLRGEVRARLNGVAEATDQLRSELEQLGAPSTAAGTAVAKELSALSARLKAHIVELQDMAAAPVGGVGELQAQAAKVRDIVSTALADVQRTVGRVNEPRPGRESCPRRWRPRRPARCSATSSRPAPPRDEDGVREHARGVSRGALLSSPRGGEVDRRLADDA